jgi:hypothetical protein
MGVGIAQCYSAGLRAARSGVRVPAGVGNFSLYHRVQSGSGAHPDSYPMGTGGSFPEGKAAEANHSPPSSAEVKNVWSYISNLSIRLHGVVLSSSTGMTLPFTLINRRLKTNDSEVNSNKHSWNLMCS